VHDQEASIKKSMNMLLHKETITAESSEYASYSIEAKNPEEEMVGLLKEVESVAGKSGVSLLYREAGDDQGRARHQEISTPTWNAKGRWNRSRPSFMTSKAPRSSSK